MTEWTVELVFISAFYAFASGYTERKISEYSRVLVETGAIRNHSVVLIESLPSQFIDFYCVYFKYRERFAINYNAWCHYCFNLTLQHTFKLISLQGDFSKNISGGLLTGRWMSKAKRTVELKKIGVWPYIAKWWLTL